MVANRTPGVGALITAGLLLAACGGDPSESNTSDVSTLEAAYDVCSGRLADEQNDDPSNPSPGEVIRLEEDGATVVTEAPTEPGGVMSEFYALRAAACVLEETDAPTDVGERMQSTNALMGRQQDHWGAYAAEWSYVPDSGLEVVFEVAQ